ncbi:MAG: NAD-dependent DNA ligase LigA [Planctomycetes bacterium]|nr:NAD-dependent DNA ligase LigA [Planctomycetota bacterium]
MSATENRIGRLREEIRRHDHAYYVLGKPTITDRQYDELLAELRGLEEENPDLVTPDSPTQRVGGAPIDGFAHVTHSVPMLSVDNTYNEAQLREFDQRVAKGLGGEKYRYVVDPKVDGVAVALHYERGVFKLAATRGDGRTGDDISHNVRTMRSVPLRLLGDDVPEVLEVRGEIVWPRADFDRYNAEREKLGEPTFANPRNATAGTLKQLDPRNVAGRGLIVIAHSFGRIEPLAAAMDTQLFKDLARWGIPVSSYRAAFDSIDEIIARLPEWDERRCKLPYETDGLVIKVDAFDQRDALGATSRYPRWCIAYKFAAEQAESVLLKVDFQVGKLGTITPRAVMEPVQLSGTTVRHASLHNFDQVDRLDVRLGDTVIVEKAGEIIPQVIAVVAEKRPKNARKIVRPTKCPECGGEVEQDEGGVYIRCINPSCPAQLKERLIFFCGRNQMDIEGAGQVLIEKMVDKGWLKSYADIYDLPRRRDELIAMEFEGNFGARNADALVNAIEDSKKLPLANVLHRLKIRALTPEVARTLSQRFHSFEELLTAGVSGLGLNSEAAREIGMVARPAPPSLAGVLVKTGRALGIKGLGEGLATRLVEHGLVTSTADLYGLRELRARVVDLPVVRAFGEKNTDALLAGIQRSKQQPLSRLLAALNIRHVGSSTAELLAEHFGSMDKLAGADEAELMEVEGIGPELAASIVHFFRSDAGRTVVRRLAEAGVNMTQPKRKVAGDSPFKGKSVVVTGTLSRMGRKEVQDLIKTLGGKPSGSVSKSTDYLLCGDSPGSKLDKAREHHVTILTEDEFFAIVESKDGAP